MTCKGVCTQYKAPEPVGVGRYAAGQRKCRTCKIFIQWEGELCPCCGYRLYTKLSRPRYVEKIRSKEAAQAVETQTNMDRSATGTRKISDSFWPVNLSPSHPPRSHTGPKTALGPTPHTGTGTSVKTTANENGADPEKGAKIDAEESTESGATKIPVATGDSADMSKNILPQNIRKYAESKSRAEIRELLQKQPGELWIAEYVSRQPERDNHMTELIKEYRGRRCQICGTSIRQKDGRFLVEAAHIDPKKDGGAETPSNILVLCPNHHAEFDVGDRRIIERTDDRIVFDLNGTRHSLDLQV